MSNGVQVQMVHFAGKFHTGQDGHIYIRLRPQGSPTQWWRPDIRVLAVNESWQLVEFPVDQLVFPLIEPATWQ